MWERILIFVLRRLSEDELVRLIRVVTKRPGVLKRKKGEGEERWRMKFRFTRGH